MTITDPHIGQGRYAILDRGIFGQKIIQGLVTGIRYTSDKPVYTLEFQKNLWEATDLFSTLEDVTEEMVQNLKSPSEIIQSAGIDLKIPNVVEI